MVRRILEADAVGGQRLEFSRTDDGFVDGVVHVDTLWFAWAADQPDSRIVE